MSSPRLLLSTALLALSLTTATAQAAEPDRNTPAPMTAAQIIAAAPASAWRTPDPDNLLYMQLPGGLVVIELAPQFAPRHVANIRQLARQGFWDGLSVYRVQDNFVAQFGDALADDPAIARPLGAAETEAASKRATADAERAAERRQAEEAAAARARQAAEDRARYDERIRKYEAEQAQKK